MAYMGPGIKDTNGNPIPLPTNPRVVRVEPVDQEGEETFAVSAFVVARFRLEYEEERRFLQEGSGEGNGRYSLAEFALRQDISSWSDLCRRSMLKLPGGYALRPGNHHRGQQPVSSLSKPI